jgi:hypothetical protein
MQIEEEHFTVVWVSVVAYPVAEMMPDLFSGGTHAEPNTERTKV